MLITRTIGLVKTQASLAKHLANPSFLVGLQEDKTGSALVHGEVVSSIEDPAAGCGKMGAVQPDVDQLLHRARMDRHLKALQLAAACNPHHLRQVPHPDSIIRGQRHDGKGTGERAQDQTCRRCLSQTAIGTCMPTQQVGSELIPVEIESQCEIDHGVGSGDRDPKSRPGLACPWRSNSMSSKCPYRWRAVHLCRSGHNPLPTK